MLNLLHLILRALTSKARLESGSIYSAFIIIYLVCVLHESDQVVRVSE